jgi:hypothetical protein
VEGSNPCKILAHEIILKAVDDWRRLVIVRAWEDKYCLKNNNFIELRQFFRSEWCALLMTGDSLTPADILRQLEKELAEAKEKDFARRNENG